MGAMQQSLLMGGATAPAAPTLPTYVEMGNLARSVGALTVNPPASYADGDLLVLLVNSANQAITTPSGWTQVTNSPQGTGTAGVAGGVRIAVFYKFASGVEADVSVADTGSYTVAQMFSFRRVNSTTPIDSTAGSVKSTATGTTFTLPAVTTTGSNDLILLCLGLDRDADSGANMSGYTNANLTNLIEIQDITVVDGVGGGIALAIGAKATAGSTGTTTATSAVATTAAFLTVALNGSTTFNDTTRVTPPDGVASDTRYADAQAAASISFNTDGSYTASGNEMALNESSWLNNIGAGNGSGFYVRATQQSLVGIGATSGTLNTWLQLNAAREFGVNTTANNTSILWSVKFDFSTSATGSPIVATSQVLFSAQTSSGPPP